MTFDELMKEKSYPYQERDTERNSAIRRAYQRRLGERGLLCKLGVEFGGISAARVHQIINGRLNREPKIRRQGHTKS
jgi:hypothetical protein